MILLVINKVGTLITAFFWTGDVVKPLGFIWTLIFIKPYRSFWEFNLSLAAIGMWGGSCEGMQQGERESFLHASGYSLSTYLHVLRRPGGKQLQQGRVHVV